jgi:acetylornithine deacetylase/succinyl-diaminopimelate desuccinylase-like protein
MSKFVRCLLPLSLLSLIFALPVASRAQVDASGHQLARDIFKQLVEINTTHSVGNVTTAAKAMEQRLLEAGFPQSDLFLGGATPRKQNLVVRYHGTGVKKPILFIGHLDVVEAPREQWHTDPFKFVEKDGYYYGRGTQDMKNADAILVASFILMRKAHYTPDRELILALTADEEGGEGNGVQWLVKSHPDLVRAGFVLNADGGGVDLVKGKPVSVDIDATEKLYGDYQLQATNPGGHSSLPVPDNAIYHVADALGRLQRHRFPFELNAVTRAYFERLSTRETGQNAADMTAIL